MPQNFVSIAVRPVSFCLLMMGVAIMTGCESERAKWNFAKAMNLRQEGELDEAISLVQIAMEQAPDNDQIKLRLAMLLSENGQGELGVILCDEHLERYPNDVKAHSIRTFCLQSLGRFDESLLDYKKEISGHVSKSALELNNLAYFRALAKQDLVRAAKEIQQAIEMEQANLVGIQKWLPLRVHAVICVGLISRTIGQRKQALRHLDHYVAQLELVWGDLEARELSRTLFEIRSGILPGDSLSKSQVELAQFERDLAKRNLALTLATRALVNEDLQKIECVDADRRRLRELGFELNEIARELPSDMACLKTLKTAYIFLDTRGFIAGRLDWFDPQSCSDPVVTKNQILNRLGNYRVALEDLDLAVLAAQFQQQALDSSLFNSRMISPKSVQQQKSEARRMTAALLYHRMEVHRRGGNEAAARADQREIEKLGFSSDSKLF